MESRSNEFDVTNRVRMTDPLRVTEEVRKLFSGCYPNSSYDPVEQAFKDGTRLFRGEYPGYLQCDTIYHDLQHTLDVTLAMARMMDGYERTDPKTRPLGARLFALGVITALFHDAGYVRRKKDTRHRNGAEYTLWHVSRSAQFLAYYLPGIGFGDLAPMATKIVHFTGYEIPPHKIPLPNDEFRLLGCMLGSADMLAQMADRCYLEKCRDRLYPEFVLGGIARRRNRDGSEDILFSSGEDLVSKTPGFFRAVRERLNDHLGGVYQYVGHHFGGLNLYLEGVKKNINYAEKLVAKRQFWLRRIPPWNSALEMFPKNVH